MKMKLSVTIVIGLLLISSTVHGATGTTLVTKYAGYTSLGGYNPVIPKSLADFPRDIREIVVNHLKERLGQSFYNKLIFSGGEIVNFDELYRVVPAAKNYKWEIHAYNLHFEFKMPEIGIASYTAQITLRMEDGTIIEDIDLPSFANFPEKLKFYPLQLAMQNLPTHGYNLDKVSKEIAYDRTKDILVWRFSQVLSDDGLTIKIKTIEISAHDGTVVREFHRQAIH